MINDIEKKAEELFSAKNGYLRTTELLKNGFGMKKIRKLEKNQKVIKIKRGLYHWVSDETSSFEQMIEISKIIPTGVFCLFTALSYYDLTTYNPPEFNMAIKRNTRKPNIPENSCVKLYNFSGIFYSTGVMEIEIDGHKLFIYDIEKTICDCVRLRNKIGFDLVKEAIKEYMRKKDRDIDKLLRYAELLKVKTIIIPFLEALT